MSNHVALPWLLLTSDKMERSWKNPKLRLDRDNKLLILSHVHFLLADHL